MQFVSSKQNPTCMHITTRGFMFIPQGFLDWFIVANSAKKLYIDTIHTNLRALNSYSKRPGHQCQQLVVCKENIVFLSSGGHYE